MWLIGGWFSDGLNWITDKISGFFSWIAEKVFAAFEWVVEQLWDMFSRLFELMKEGFLWLIDLLLTPVYGLVEMILNALPQGQLVDLSTFGVAITQINQWVALDIGFGLMLTFYTMKTFVWGIMFVVRYFVPTLG